MQQRKAQALPKGIGTLCDWYVARAENATLWDQEGNSWIDFAGGIAVLNTGHRHPRIEQAIADQLTKFTHTAFQITPYESYIALAERINQRVPHRRCGENGLLHHRGGSGRKCRKSGACLYPPSRHHHLWVTHSMGAPL
ncbi:4-aminobutyrate aminotransferase PuuE [Pantoea agglomerans]|uniref:4-aminobutyrate aminotransferase PuuE n=1 Tax=Enterobacter agglomerans TaxID=549 RepID=A0A379LS83_ENTAG|nr:4-aminobutyrate aminotransferase PuuE [Pantoea agglomerans]